MLKQANLPPLAQYRQRLEYTPHYGDYIIWSRWFSTWHGFVVEYDKEKEEVHVIFAGLPFLLMTMDESEHKTATTILSVSKIKRAANGEYAIQQNIQGGTTIWYI